MNFLLDTNAAIGIINEKPEQLRSRVRRELASGASLSISSVVLFELWYGIANSKRWEENANALRSFLSRQIDVLVFGAEDARAAGELRATIRTAGLPIGPYDLLIAAQAARLGLTLVTANRVEFERVPGLMIQDWTT